MKIAIKVLNKKHSKVTQELLFSHGYKWISSGKQVQWYPDRYILIYETGRNIINYNEQEIENSKIMRIKELKEYLQNIS